MVGITGYVSIMTDDENYKTLSRIDKLKHDLHCLKIAGWSGPSSGAQYLNNVKKRNVLIDDVERQILQEERCEKLKKINI